VIATLFDGGDLFWAREEISNDRLLHNKSTARRQLLTPAIDELGLVHRRGPATKFVQLESRSSCTLDAMSSIDPAFAKLVFFMEAIERRELRRAISGVAKIRKSVARRDLCVD
jgi:hypothetical protein